MRRLPSRLRCLVTKALMTCAASLRGVGAPVAVLPQHGDDDVRVAPRGHADEPGVGACCPVPVLVRASASWPTTCAVPVLPAKSMPSRCDGAGRAGRPGDGGHGVGDGLPVVGRERDRLFAGAGEVSRDGALHLLREPVREDHVGPVQHAARRDAAERAGQLHRA